MDEDNGEQVRKLIQTVQADLPEVATSSIMSDTSIISALNETELEKTHKSHVFLILFILFYGSFPILLEEIQLKQRKQRMSHFQKHPSKYSREQANFYLLFQRLRPFWQTNRL